MKPTQLLTVFVLMDSLTLQAQKQSAQKPCVFSYNISFAELELLSTLVALK